jgi:hypothetical protein
MICVGNWGYTVHPAGIEPAPLQGNLRFPFDPSLFNKCASSGNRTRAASLEGKYDTTSPWKHEWPLAYQVSYILGVGACPNVQGYSL